jgi:hypothetical protein
LLVEQPTLICRMVGAFKDDPGVKKSGGPRCFFVTHARADRFHCLGRRCARDLEDAPISACGTGSKATLTPLPRRMEIGNAGSGWHRCCLPVTLLPDARAASHAAANQCVSPNSCHESIAEAKAANRRPASGTQLSRPSSATENCQPAKSFASSGKIPMGSNFFPSSGASILSAVTRPACTSPSPCAMGSAAYLVSKPGCRAAPPRRAGFTHTPVGRTCAPWPQASASGETDISRLGSRRGIVHRDARSRPYGLPHGVRLDTCPCCSARSRPRETGGRREHRARRKLFAC